MLDIFLNNNYDSKASRRNEMSNGKNTLGLGSKNLVNNGPTKDQKQEQSLVTYIVENRTATYRSVLVEGNVADWFINMYNAGNSNTEYHILNVIPLSDEQFLALDGILTH
jgi:hypothetical protein